MFVYLKFGTRILHVKRPYGIHTPRWRMYRLSLYRGSTCPRTCAYSCTNMLGKVLARRKPSLCSPRKTLSILSPAPILARAEGAFRAVRWIWNRIQKNTISIYSIYFIHIFFIQFFLYKYFFITFFLIHIFLYGVIQFRSLRNEVDDNPTLT